MTGDIHALAAALHDELTKVSLSVQSDGSVKKMSLD